MALKGKEFGLFGMKMGRNYLKVFMLPALQVFSKLVNGLSGMRMVKRNQREVMFMTD